MSEVHASLHLEFLELQGPLTDELGAFEEATELQADVQIGHVHLRKRRLVYRHVAL